MRFFFTFVFLPAVFAISLNRLNWPYPDADVNGISSESQVSQEKRQSSVGVKAAGKKNILRGPVRLSLRDENTDSEDVVEIEMRIDATDCSGVSNNQYDYNSWYQTHWTCDPCNRKQHGFITRMVKYFGERLFGYSSDCASSVEK